MTNGDVSELEEDLESGTGGGFELLDRCSRKEERAGCSRDTLSRPAAPSIPVGVVRPRLV